MEPIFGTGTQDDGKTAGIISYFTIIGWLIAYFAIHQNKKTSLGSYQLRQTLLLHIIAIVVVYGFSIVFGAILLSAGGFFLTWYYVLRLLELGLFILWLIGLIGAINGDKKPIPFIGDRAQTVFPGI